MTESEALDYTPLTSSTPSPDPRFAQDISLITLAQQGDETAMEKLVVDNMGLVRTVAVKFRDRGTEFEDLMQIGTLGMIKAIHSFDTTRGTAFSTYAVPKVDYNAGGRDEIAPIFQKINETFGRDVFSIPSEDLTPIVRDNYTAVLLICDTESGNVGEFYSVEGARGGKLSVSEDGKLIWEAESFVDTFYSLATSSFTIGGTCRIYRYTFDANGALIGAEKTDDYTIYRQ